MTDLAYAQKLLEAVGDRLRGVHELLRLLAARAPTPDVHVLEVAADAIDDQLVMLENDLLPLVTRRPRMSGLCIMAKNLPGEATP